MQVNCASRLYWIELLTGKGQLIGSFPSDHHVTDLAAGFQRDSL